MGRLMMKIEHNVETNEIVEVPLNNAEIAEIEAQKIIDAEQLAEAEAKAAEKAQQATEKAALLEKLGITADEAALLLS